MSLVILITGATGFIGCRMAEKFNAVGDKLALLGCVRTNAEKARAVHLRSLGLHVKDVDLTEQRLTAYTHGVDVVIHLAAAQHEADKPRSYFEKINVTGTQNLLEAASASGVRRFIYGSTIGVYGDVSGIVIDDDFPVAPDNDYSESKVNAEEVVASYRDRLQVSIARISETYGPGDFRLLKLFRGIQKGVFFVVGAGHNSHQLLYVDDLISGIREMMTSDAVIGQRIVLAGDEVFSTDELCEYISNAVGSPMHSFHLPLWPFIITAYVCEQTLGRVGINPPLHRRRLDFFRKSLEFSSERRNRLLEWRPHESVAEGTLETAKWYCEQSLLHQT